MATVETAASKLDRLEFLDGLRGWGAICVLNRHLFVMFLFRGNPSAEYLIHWIPFFFDGAQAVSLFFIVSGFAITTPYFRSGGKRLLLLDGAVRRYPRLVLPILGSSFFAYLLMCFGFMHNVNIAGIANSTDWLGVHYRFQPDIFNLIRFSLFDVFVNYQGSDTYNSSLWTMSYELGGSLFIFGLLALMGQWRHKFWGYLLVIVLLKNSIFLPFIVGVVLADAYHGTLVLPARIAEILCKLRNVPHISLLILAGAIVLSILSNPLLFNFRRSAGLTLVGTMLLISAMLDGPARSFFTSRPSRIFGKLSFPIYLVHVPIICSWSSWLYFKLNTQNIEVSIMAALVSVTTYVLVILVSVVFGRLVEAPSTTLSRRWGKMVVKV